MKLYITIICYYLSIIMKLLATLFVEEDSLVKHKVYCFDILMVLPCALGGTPLNSSAPV